MKLSVVLITKNQEWNVDRLITSVHAGTSPLDGQSETVLVDSASTDKTVPLAEGHDVTVFQLTDDQRLTAAAGRYVGFRNTSGEYILFLDGDMELISGWLEGAIDLLDKEHDIAVIGGERIDLPLDTTQVDNQPLSPTSGDRTITDVPHVGGAALYRRSVLDAVGTFNPFIYSDEEPELCIRIRYRAQSRVIRLGTPIVYHYSDPDDRFSTLIRRARRNLYMGAGQNLRILLGTELLGPYARERGHGLLPGLWLVIGSGAIVAWVVTGSALLAGAWLAATVGVIAIDGVRKRSLRQALHSMLKRSLIVDGTVRGFLMKPESAEDYPARLANSSIPGS